MKGFLFYPNLQPSHPGFLKPLGYLLAAISAS